MRIMARGYTHTKITVIGGGTGLSVLLRGLKQLTDNLTAVVAVSDDGGNSGILREDLGMLPPGDVRSCLLALADDESVMQALLKYRFSNGRLEGQNVGNLIIAALNEIYGSFEVAIEKMSDILKITGTVVPVTDDRITLCAELANGNIVVGESRIPEAAVREKSHIKRVFMHPERPAAANAAIDAIKNAEIIIVGPGSLYTSIIANLLIDGIADALKKSRAKKYYICNVMSQPGETDDYSVANHLTAIEEYMGEHVIDCIIANNKPLARDVLDRYEEDGAKQLLPTAADREYCDAHGITLIENEFIDVKKGYIRHDALRIANMVTGLAHDF